MIGRRVIIAVDTSGCLARRSHTHQATRRTTPHAADASVARRRPAPRVALRDRQQHGRQAGGQAGGTEPVDGPVELRGRAGTTSTAIAMTTSVKPGRQPEDAVITGVAVHQQADHDQSGAAAEAQRSGQHRHRRPMSVLGELLAQDRDADRVERVRRGLQHAGEDQQRQRRGGRGEYRADEHDDEHAQQHVFLAVQVGEPTDQRGGGRRGEKVRGDRPADRHRRRVQLVGDDAEDRHDGGLKHRDGQHHHGEACDEQPGPPGITAEAGPRRFGLDHGPLRSLAHLRFFRLCLWPKSAINRSCGSAGERCPSRPTMSSLTTSALSTASSTACTTAV